MLNILKSDFYKMRKSKTFLFSMVGCVAFAILVTVTMRVEPDMFEYFGGTGALIGNIPSLMHIYATAAFVAIFISSEFRNGTIKNIISRGTGRIVVVFSKFIVCSIGAITIMIVFMVALVAMGTILMGFDPNGILSISGLVKIIALQGLTAIGFTALFALMTMTIRNLGGAIAANFAWVAIAIFIFGVIDIGEFWLAWNVFTFSTFSIYTADVVHGIVLALSWIVLTMLLSTATFAKRDIK